MTVMCSSHVYHMEYNILSYYISNCMNSFTDNSVNEVLKVGNANM